MTANVNIDLRGVQEKVEDKTEHARRLGRKAALASIGMFGLAYDAGKATWHGSIELVDKAEHRGEEIEEAFNERVTEMQNKVTDEMHTRRTQLEGTIDGVSKGVSDRGKSVEQQVQKAFSRVKIGSGDSATVEAGQIKIEVEVSEEAPIEGYDDLTAQEVIDRIPQLSPEAVEKVRAYESAHKKRVTVLREAGEVQETPTDPGFPEQTG